MLHVRLSLTAGVCVRACYVLLHFHLNKHLYLNLAVVLIIIGEIN